MVGTSNKPVQLEMAIETCKAALFLKWGTPQNHHAASGVTLQEPLGFFALSPAPGPPGHVTTYVGEHSAPNPGVLRLWDACHQNSEEESATQTSQ